MLYSINWKIGVQESGNWICPIEIYRDLDDFIKMRFLDDEDSGSAPICLEVMSGVYVSWCLDMFINGEYCDCQMVDKYGDMDAPKTDETQESWDAWHKWLSAKKSWYGVADDLDQVLVYFKDEINNANSAYVIGISEIRKSDQPESGGWRWHKWGPYIGIQNQQHEYLYDEKDIDSVLLFHLYQIKVIGE